MSIRLEGDLQKRNQFTGELTPSPALAWIIGTLSGKGTVNNKRGEISLGNRNEDVQREFIRLGEEVFGVNIPYRHLWTYREGKPITYLGPSFFNMRIARALGNLGRTQFPETIEESHAWILRDPSYTYEYAEGLYEARGNVYKRSGGETKDIIIQTSFPHVAAFIAKVVTKLGVIPTIVNQRMGTELRTRGVTISTLPEQRKFAELIHSLDLEKEEKLKEFRGISLERAQTRVKSKDELVDEWRKMTDLLGHPPNMNEISDLFRDGKTKWTHETYAYWFGETETTKRFSIARKQLIAITNPELIQEKLNALAKRQQRRVAMSQKRTLRLQRAEKRERLRTERDQALQPSRELAWVLGLLASGGDVNQKNGAMSLASPDQSLQKAYINVAGNLFKTNLTWQTLRSVAGEGRQIPQFNNTVIARGLGDLKRAVWPTTIAERHSWIIENQEYTWAFLSGIFDDKGIFSGTDRNHLVIPTAFRRGAYFIAELMTNVGIQNPLISKSRYNREGVQGIAIANIRDLQRFASNIHSVVPEKEQRLGAIRSDTTRKPRNLAPFDKNEMIAEWRRLYEVLGHPPNVTDITELYVEGKTRWSAGVYKRVFGRTGTNRGGSYIVALESLATACGLEITEPGSIRYRRPDSKYKHIKDTSDLVAQYRQLRAETLKDKRRLPVTSDFDRARRLGLITYSRVTFANYFGEGKLINAIKKLEDLILREDIVTILEDYERQSGIQVKYVPKNHPVYNFEAVNRLIGTINEAHQQATISVLVGPDGKSPLIHEGTLT